MLILTQRVSTQGDTVVITIPPCASKREIRVALLGVKGNQARIGYEAPREVTIDREIVHQRKLAEGTI